MSRRLPLLTILAGAALFLPSAAPAQDKDAKDRSKAVGTPKPVPAIPGYEKQTIHGFTLLINDEVYKNNDDRKWKRKPIAVLEGELGTIVRRLPDRTVKALRNLLIWVEWQERTDPDLGKAVAKYYGGTGNISGLMLRKGKHPLKAHNIEVVDMLSLTREHQPWVKLERCVLMDEMSHAVHMQVFGRDNPGIKGAYQAAMARGLYDKVKDVFGRERVKPYSTTSHAEYFAELSCAYLDKLHYFPFNGEVLQKHDPVGYKVMEQTWGTRKAIDAALVAKMNRQASARLEAAHEMSRRGKTKEAIAALEWLLEEMPDAKVAPSVKKLLEKLKG